MPTSKCHICGKFGPYAEMIDDTVYSVHPRCEHKLIYIVEEFQNCSICKKSEALSKGELRSHLIDNHTKESLVD